MQTSTVKFSQIEDRLDAKYYKSEFLSFYEKFFQKKFISIDKFITYNRRGVQPIYVDNSDYHALTSQYIQPEGIKYEQLPFVSENFFNKTGDALIKLEDIVIYTTGAYVGNTQIWLDKNTNAIASNHVNILRVKNINPYFLTAVLVSEIGAKQIKRIISGATQAELYSSDIAKILIPNIALENQNKIGSLIANAHRKRQIARQKYQEAQNLLEKFLKIDEQKLDFKNCFSLSFSKIEDRIDGGYYQALSLLKLPMFKQGSVPLGDLATISAGKTPAKQTYAKKGVKILKARDLTNQGIDWQNSERTYIKPEIWQKIKKAQVQKGDILVLSAAHQAHYIGKHIDIVFDIPEQFNDKLSAVAELLIIRPKTINPYVLLWYLRTKTAYLLIQRLITGETSHLYPKDLINLPVPKILLNFKNGSDMANKTKQSMLLQKESKNLLEQAKQEVENLIGANKP